MSYNPSNTVITEKAIIELAVTGQSPHEILSIITNELKRYPTLKKFNGRLFGLAKEYKNDEVLNWNENIQVEGKNKDEIIDVITYEFQLVKKIKSFDGQFIGVATLDEYNNQEECANERLKFKTTINTNELEVPVKVSDLGKMLDEIKRLRYHEASTVGLWVIDQKPSKVKYKWIKKNAFKIKKNRS